MFVYGNKPENPDSFKNYQNWQISKKFPNFLKLMEIAKIDQILGGTGRYLDKRKSIAANFRKAQSLKILTNFIIKFVYTGCGSRIYYPLKWLKGHKNCHKLQIVLSHPVKHKQILTSFDLILSASIWTNFAYIHTAAIM